MSPEDIAKHHVDRIVSLLSENGNDIMKALGYVYGKVQLTDLFGELGSKKKRLSGIYQGDNYQVKTTVYYEDKENFDLISSVTAEVLYSDNGDEHMSICTHRASLDQIAGLL